MIDSSRDTTSRIGGSPKPRNEGGDSVPKVGKNQSVRMADRLKNASPEILGNAKHETGSK